MGLAYDGGAITRSVGIIGLLRTTRNFSTLETPTVYPTLYIRTPLSTERSRANFRECPKGEVHE